MILPYATNFIHKLWISHQNELKKITNDKVLTKKEFGELQRKFHELELSFDDTFSKKDTEINQLKKRLDDKDHLHLESLNKIDEYKKDEANHKTHTIENLELKEKVNDFEKQQAENDTLINNLINENSKFKEQVTNKNININSIEKIQDINSLPKAERKLLEYIGNHKENFTTQISENSGLDLLSTEHYLDNLISLDYINIQEAYDNGESRYVLTAKGRKRIMVIRTNEESEIPF